MKLILNALVIVMLGAILGLGSAAAVLESNLLGDTQRIGPWRTGPLQALGAGNPYAAARLARSGAVPLGAAEGVSFVAETDSDGAALDPACHYAVEGGLVWADLWTLTVDDHDGRLPDNPARRFGFTSRDVLREATDRFRITVGRTARPGNFVPTGALTGLRLTLRIYDADAAARLAGDIELPTIRRSECP